ncbi:hypothetical protein LOC68_27390 [Blastopirellula sp. JC732]|uniref:Uncharacterized protein n=1 Tax=Blastopirellula sediminis TaxID=2894196 RepID=A0A9X1MSN5_9BACT|nr:hypothetical protein [Blastopirellula sediminis]MCC9604565.1 hypothetical protein [Blastopirellula sediminis]MCC9632136.1 hypothetical protein [Blastopirellula sediminis]
MSAVWLIVVCSLLLIASIILVAFTYRFGKASEDVALSHARLLEIPERVIRERFLNPSSTRD